MRSCTEVCEHPSHAQFDLILVNHVAKNAFIYESNSIMSKKLICTFAKLPILEFLSVRLLKYIKTFCGWGEVSDSKPNTLSNLSLKLKAFNIP